MGKATVWLAVAAAAASALLAGEPPARASSDAGASTRHFDASRQVNDGLPRRWFAVIESQVAISYFGKVSTERTFARVTFTLSKVVRTRYRGERYATYLYRPTGTLEASYDATGGDCTWHRSGTVRLQPVHGVLEMRVVSLPGKRTYLEYGSDSAGPYGTRAPTLPLTMRCPEHTHTAPDAIHWTGIPQSSRGKPTARSLEGTWNYAGSADGFRRWCLTRRQSDLEECTGELEAVARVSGSTLRAATRRLDGARSKGDIKRYEWTFEQAVCAGDLCAGYCDTVGPRSGAKKRGVRTTIKPLCAVEATLTVSDAQDEDSDTILVPVTPRTQGWRTQVLHRWAPTPATGGPSGAPRGEPIARCSPDGSCTVELKGGLNVPDPQGCVGQEVKGSRILCPLLNGKRTWSGRGYTLATIADPGGPFDGYAYVGGSTLVVRRLAYINPALISGAFHDYNKAHEGQIDGLLEATKQHEGFGAPGKPGTGHSQIMRDVISGSGGLNDPRHELERMLARTSSTVQELADKEIRRIDLLADERSDDPLRSIGRFALWFYDPVGAVWTPGLLTVP